MKIKRIISYIPLIIWMAVIFLFSAQTSENSSETSSLPAAILARIINPDFAISIRNLLTTRKTSGFFVSHALRTQLTKVQKKRRSYLTSPKIILLGFYF